MIEKLNIEAFELIDLVMYKPNEISMERAELSGSIKERGFVDLSDKIVGHGIERTTDHIGNTISIFINEEYGSYGFIYYQMKRICSNFSINVTSRKLIVLCKIHLHKLEVIYL